MVGVGALERLVADVRAGFDGRLAIVLTDSNVAPLHGLRVRDALRASGLEAHLLEFPAGEAQKTRETKARLEDALLDLPAGRDTVIVAVGGGVVGDVAGFLASTWHRGVPVVQAPTTLLAMADAALGGKTGVDAPGAKNVIGAFHQPWALYADIATLDTLPEADYRRGFAEVIKTAVIADARLFRVLESRAGRLRERDPALVESVIVRCLRIKGRIVSSDERDHGPRASLNFGHTIAHALEAATDWAMPHGDAVAVGIVIESRLASTATGFPQSDSDRVETVVKRYGLPAAPPAGVDAGQLIAATRRDKKSKRGRPRYALPEAIGRMPNRYDPTCEVTDHDVRRALDGAV